MSGTQDGLPSELIDTMQVFFSGKTKQHPGYRTTHAKGYLVEGTFTPTEDAKTLSIAAHFNNPSTPLIARFSVGGGIPSIRDDNKDATPKGVAIRFKISDDVHTDLISHSFNGFATRTGEGFLQFLQLATAQKTAQKAFDDKQAAGGDTTQEQAALNAANKNLGAFAAANPSVAKFIGGPKPNPVNYGTLTYYEPNTHVLTNKDGKTTNIRYRLLPADGDQLVPPEKLASLPWSYLEDDLKQRFPAKPITFTLTAHIAGPNDVLDDATIAYTSTTFVPVGKIVFNKVTEDNWGVQQKIAFSPTPDLGGIKGITASKDPLIQIRKGVYYISTEQRRAGPPVGPPPPPVAPKT